MGIEREKRELKGALSEADTRLTDAQRNRLKETEKLETEQQAHYETRGKLLQSNNQLKQLEGEISSLKFQYDQVLANSGYTEEELIGYREKLSSQESLIQRLSTEKRDL